MSDKSAERAKPQCGRVVLHGSGVRRRCTRDGYACWVIGEFGRQAQVLCGPCITAVRATGWKVSYQIEGDGPANLGVAWEREV